MNPVYLSTPVSALMKELYEEDTIIANIKKHGDFGLGTFNDLNGEMVMLDGRAYQLETDGLAHSVDDAAQMPFTCVTFFHPTSKGCLSRAKVQHIQCCFTFMGVCLSTSLLSNTRLVIVVARVHRKRLSFFNREKEGRMAGYGRMERTREQEIRNKDLMAPCGLYCGACGIYIATRDGNEKFKAILGKLYGTKPEDTECYGCMQTDPPKKMYSYCKICKIRNCIQSKKYYSCHQCNEWPCDWIDNFILATGVRVMKRAIPVWRTKVAEHGDEAGSVEWARSECERYHCPACGNPLFRGAQQCRSCKKPLADELDGSI